MSALADVVAAAPTGLTVAVAVVDDTGVELHGDAQRPMSIASVGKLLLLIEVARQLEDGSLIAEELLTRGPADLVADSGIWQHLAVPALTVSDLAVLVASVSDNLATNVLLSRVGLPAVEAVAVRLGLARTRLHDRVRDRRLPEHPPRLATGTAAELAGLLAAAHRGRVISPEVSARLLGWLRFNADLSMTAGALGLDPLAHAEADAGLRLWTKTGTDAGVRVDAGVMAGPHGWLAYSVLVGWEPGVDADSELLVRRAALRWMAEVGAGLGRRIGSEPVRR